MESVKSSVIRLLIRIEGKVNVSQEDLSQLSTSITTMNCEVASWLKRSNIRSYKFIDHSFSSAVDEGWKKKARSRIGATDFVIFLCGANTHAAPGVEAEMTITQQLQIPYILLKGRRYEKCSKPRSARKSDKIQSRKWKHIDKLLDK